jgi:Phage tail assembly chaperone protein
MIAYTYNIETGTISNKISFFVGDGICHAVEDGEAIYETSVDAYATHIINNEPVTIIPEVIPQTAEELMAAIRAKRNQKLSACDWTQTLDSPLTPEKKAEWAAYRQLLRDFPETCDINAPVWPVAPN